MKITKILVPLFLLLSLLISTASFAEGPETDIYPYRTTSFAHNDMRIINTGIAALYARLDMIRRAEHTLELEYFIFNPDTSGRIVLKELVKAAQKGVQVRILVDKSMAVFKLDEFYARTLKEHNIELRYYNAAPVFRISSVQFRNHRKLIVRDGVEAITGGRNIADEYFNLSKTFNFLDRDVWVGGEIVKAMRDSFNLYWKSDIVEIPSEVKIPTLNPAISNGFRDQAENTYKQVLASYNKKIDEANEVLADNEEDNKVLSFIFDYGKKALLANSVYTCPEASFATDREGASFIQRIHSKDYNQNYRLLRKEIAKWLDRVQDEVILDSPYFLNDANSREILTNLLDSNKKITILTNSLGSTDAVYVSTVFNSTVKEYTPNENFNAYIYSGKFSNESELYNDEIRNSDWGTHSKTIVFNNDSFMVGTFNIDNRSNFYNTEMSLFCGGSPELAKDVKDNIQLRMKTAHHLNKQGLPDDGTPLLGEVSLKKKLLYFFLKVPSTIMQFLM